MAILPRTTFLESPKDRPSPEIRDIQASDGPVSSPVSEPIAEESSSFFFEGEITPERIVECCVATRRHEERMRRVTKEMGDETYERYHGRYDHSGKEDWQSKKMSPKLAIAVERLVATLSRIREKSTDWFTIDSLEEPAELYYNLVKKLIDFFLKHDDVNFNGVFRRVLKTGLLQQMMYVMVAGENDGHLDTEPAGEGQEGDIGITTGFEAIASLSQSTEEGDTGAPTLPGAKAWKPRVEVLNPDYVYKDHTNRNRYIIWEQRYTKGEAKREADTRGWDVEALKRAIQGTVSVDDNSDTAAGFHESTDANKQDRLADQKSYTRVKITNYFGDLYDEDTGDLLLENQYFIVANDAELLYGPIDNPFWHGGFPIIDAPCIEVPFAAYGRSPIVWNLDMYDLYIEYLNLTVDFMQSILLGIKEVDISMLANGKQSLGALFPGKKVMIDGQGLPNASAIKNVPFSDIPQGFWPHMQQLQKELSDNVMLSDSIGGQDRTRGRVTAMEFNRRATDAGALIDFMFGTFEDNLLAPVIRQLFYTILQFMPQKQWAEWIETHKLSISPKDPQMKELWDMQFEELKSWGPQERFKKMGGFYKFGVKVFSALADRQMEIEKGTFLMQTVSQIPGAAQHVKWPKLLRHIVKAFGWDPEEIITEQALPLPVDPQPQADQPNGENVQERQGPSLGAPTSISTSPPSIPSSSGAPGTQQGSAPTGPREQ